jgi:hypothetical protein
VRQMYSHDGGDESLPSTRRLAKEAEFQFKWCGTIAEAVDVRPQAMSIPLDWIDIEDKKQGREARLCVSRSRTIVKKTVDVCTRRSYG